MMAPALLLGFLIAGLISVFLSADYVKKHLGKKGFVSIIKASLFGVPLPLCSCGVLPVGVALKKQGASKGSVTSFLISTPQTGVDSIFVTYSLLGLVYAVFRPVAAFFSGVLGGIIVDLFDKKEEPQNHADLKGPEAECCELNPEKKDGNKFIRIFRYAFVDLMDDIALSLVMGLFIAAVISIAIPDNWFVNVIGTGFVSMILMMLLGIPLYVCATASVPIAAAFIAKGVTPGAALVFLIAGPATNAAAIAVLIKILGKRSIFLYLFSIAFTALLSGIALDAVYTASSILPVLAAHEHCSISYLEKCSGILLLILLVISIVRRNILPRFKKTDMCCSENIMIFDVKGMSCAHCAATIKDTLQCISGIHDVSVNLSRKTLAVKLEHGVDPALITGRIQHALKEKGFDAGLRLK